MLVKDILRVTKGKLIIGNENERLENFSKDTRQINEGDTYLGIKGEKFDGNVFWKDALKNGAKAVIVQGVDFQSEDLSAFNEKIIIKVENTMQALYKIAEFKRSQYNIPVIGITGSVGKTSTKDIIANVVAQKYKTLKTQGNNNNNIGLPFTILKLKDEEAMVLEMGMNHFGEISVLTNIAKPTACVITNIGTSHIGNLGSRENILKAKLEILEGLEKNGSVIINNDNDLLHKWAQENSTYNVQTYGIENKSDYMAYNLNMDENESTYKYNEKNVKVTVPGLPFIYNSLSAIAVGKLLNIPDEDVIKGIASLELTKKRMEKTVTKDGLIVINDSYNASLDSVKPAIEQLKITTGNTKIAVLGDMLELGNFAKELHEQVGEAVVKNNIDILITIGENATYIAETAREKGMESSKIYHYNTIEEATKKIKELAKRGDVILLKASNSMHFNNIAIELKK